MRQIIGLLLTILQCSDDKCKRERSWGNSYCGNLHTVVIVRLKGVKQLTGCLGDKLEHVPSVELHQGDGVVTYDSIVVLWWRTGPGEEKASGCERSSCHTQGSRGRG